MLTLAYDLGKTYGELTERITMDELDMWITFYKERDKTSAQANGNLATQSNEDILKGFGL